MNVLVFGCGPAGLMAVHSAAMWGHDVKVVSRKRKSEMFGAQYLHRDILGIDTGKPRLISYKLLGTTKQYSAKVYGSDYKGSVSPDELTESHQAWNIRRAYDDLWDNYGEYVIDFMVDADNLRVGGSLYGLVQEADLVISSIPAPLLCTTDHQFMGQDIWAIGDAPERGVFDPVKAAEPDSVVCNGEPDVGWYRSANVFGRSTTEWPERRKPPLEGVARVTKPLSTNCDCFPDIMRVGRYGKWQKGVLSHSAFYEVEERLTAQGFQGSLF